MKTTTYGEIKDLAAELSDRTRDKLPLSEAAMLLTFLAAELPDIWNREAWPELSDNMLQLPVIDATISKLISATVAGAGTELVDGTLTVDPELVGDRPWYHSGLTLTGEFSVEGTGPYIVFLSGRWYIGYSNAGTETNYYASEETDALTPDLVETWSNQALAGSNPVPTVTFGYMGDVMGVFSEGNPRTTTIYNEVEYSDIGEVIRVITEQTSLYVDFQDEPPDLTALEEDDLDDFEIPWRFKLPLAWLGAAHLLETEDTIRASKLRTLAEAWMEATVANNPRRQPRPVRC